MAGVSQTLRQRIALSTFLRKAMRTVPPDAVAMSDSDGSVKLKPKVFCQPDLDGWNLIHRTLYR